MLDIEKLKALSDKILNEAMQQAVQDGAKVALTAIQNAAPPSSNVKREGNWAHTQDVVITYNRKSKDLRDVGPWTGVLIGPAKRAKRERAPQGYWMEHGRRGGIKIVPVKNRPWTRTRKTLHWVKDGKDYFRKSVILGAQEAKPWENPAFEAVKTTVLKTISDRFFELIEKGMNG